MIYIYIYILKWTQCNFFVPCLCERHVSFESRICHHNRYQLVKITGVKDEIGETYKWLEQPGSKTCPINKPAGSEHSGLTQLTADVITFEKAQPFGLRQVLTFDSSHTTYNTLFCLHLIPTELKRCPTHNDSWCDTVTQYLNIYYSQDCVVWYCVVL